MFRDNQPAPNQPPENNATETIIGHSVKVEGDFITEGNIIVEGIVCGTIKTARNLKIGSKSKIYADISCENALIAGEVQGNLKVNNKLELTASAKIFGDVKVKVLSVAAGSILNGKCQMADAKTKSAKPDFSKQEKIQLEDKNEEDKKATPASPKKADK